MPTLFNNNSITFLKENARVNFYQTYQLFYQMQGRQVGLPACTDDDTAQALPVSAHHNRCSGSGTLQPCELFQHCFNTHCCFSSTI